MLTRSVHGHRRGDFPDLEAHEIGTYAQVECVADVVRATVRSAEIGSADDVHFVQIKCPLLTSDRIAAAGGPRQQVTP